MKLAEDEREVLTAEIAQMIEQIRAPELRAEYGELLAAVDQEREVPDDLLGPLQKLLEIGLDTGRIRRLHTAHGEMAARRVWNRTPRGREVRAAVEGVNDALKALQGQTLEALVVSPTGPGAYSISIATSEGTVLLLVDRQGAHLQSVEVGG